jgi:hypothetical protein
MIDRSNLDRIARIARTLIVAALLNKDVQAHLSNPALAGIWTIDAVRRCPPVRVGYPREANSGSGMLESGVSE